MNIETDLGTHNQEDEHVFNGVNYWLEIEVDNTESDAERCEHGYDMPHTIESSTSIELLEAFTGVDLDEPVTNVELLKELESDLYNY